MTVTNAIMYQQYVPLAAEATNNVHKVNILTDHHVNYPQLPVLCTVFVLFTFIKTYMYIQISVNVIICRVL